MVVLLEYYASFIDDHLVVGEGHWDIDGCLTRNSNFSRGCNFELFLYFSERFVYVAADYPGLAAALDQVFKNLNVEVVSESDYVEFG